MRNLTTAAPLSHYWPSVLRCSGRRTLASPHPPTLFSCGRGATKFHNRTTTNLHSHLQIAHGTRGLRNTATMSLVDEKHEWGAARVRDTFLQYFKDRGHTFG